MDILDENNTTLVDINTKPAKGQKVFIKTFGCQMNVYDSERMSDALVKDGYVTTDTPDDADLVLLNTCHIREKAAEKVYSDLGRLHKMKTKRMAKGGSDLMVAVTGCVAQAEGKEIIKRAPVVNMVVGPATYHQLPDVLRRARKGERVVETEFTEDDKFEHLPRAQKKQIRARGITAFLTVQEGCDKFCTFCVVPYTRGSEISRPVSQLISEAEDLVAAGVREITLLGQNVNGWHGKGDDGREWGLGELLHRLAEIKNLGRLRYTTSHPRDMDEALINAHRDLKELMPYLHLPVQSGSDKILKSMNRRHTRDEYIALIKRVRDVRPDLALSGDFIVGFPGETDQDFEDTLDLIRQVKYAQAYSFKYSPRPGTPGADFKDHVPEDIKALRLKRLQVLIAEQGLEFSEKCVGKEIDLLLEKPGKHPGQLIGRSPWLQSVVIDAKDAQIGDIIKVRITRAAPFSLNADVI
jgi:tRNA-2-methylthio-N6-dimethylallyladenosine synthase